MLTDLVPRPKPVIRYLFKASLDTRLTSTIWKRGGAKLIKKESTSKGGFIVGDSLLCFYLEVWRCDQDGQSTHVSHGMSLGNSAN